MELPTEIEEHIKSFLIRYRMPNHAKAINEDRMFCDFIIERELYYEDGIIPFWDNTFFKYKNYTNLCILQARTMIN